MLIVILKLRTYSLMNEIKRNIFCEVIFNFMITG
jgi:hypothetical protein